MAPIARMQPAKKEPESKPLALCKHPLRRMQEKFSFFFLFLPLITLSLVSSLHGGQTIEEMLLALEITAQIDKQLYESFPATFNHLFSTGYFVTHSARMTEAGSIGIGVAHAPPYLNLNGRIQPFTHLELSANYRIFKDCADAVLGPYGFGDYADRGANFKFAIFTPEESLYLCPGLAFGIDDFMGSKKFTTYYVVGTQVIKEYGLEASFGWGAGQYTHGPSRGFFGAFSWFPWWSCQSKWVRGLGFSAEYDPTNYKKNPHPNGRSSHTPINFGAKYTLCNFLELSASCLRGEVFAASGSLRYQWGSSQGFVPKIGDPPPYATRDTEPLGCYRPQNVMIQEMNYALEGQGFQLTKAWLEKKRNGQACLWLTVMNCRYRQEHCTRMRLQMLLASLTPANVDTVIVIIESLGLPCQQYVYDRNLLVRYATQCIGNYEFDILVPRENALPPPCNAEMIFQRRYELWRSRISPRLETFFGNARGKFKYALGVKTSLEGFLPHNWFYEWQASYTALSTMNNIKDFDFFHPSQLPNVATDYIRYRQHSKFTWDIMYLQKNWNLGKGFFGRIAGGYFQVNYAGIASEALWYPAHSCFAIGLEGAVVKKRKYSGLGFQSTLRHFEGNKPIFRHYSTLQQYFLNFYFDYPAYNFFAKLGVGQFLARDKGVRLEATRYFDNGVRLTGWLTCTNANDIMHGESYFDRGIALEIPLDIFFKCSSRRVWNYAMAAWLRDAGYAITTGKTLFDTINRERRW